MRFIPLLLICSTLVFGEGKSKAVAHGDMGRFVGEQLDFSLQLRGVSAAKARMRCETVNAGSRQITADISTKFWADLIFPVHNVYQTVIDRQNGWVLETLKKIKQKNLSQEIRVVYDQPQLQAKSSMGDGWRIVPDHQTIFAMLYHLRGLDLCLSDSVFCVLDVESQLWRVSGTVYTGECVTGPFSRLAVRELALDFSPYENHVIRNWKTDLLTNRIARQGRLLIRLGPPPENLPLWIQLGSGKQTVTLKLVSVKRV
jgi:hypothetical protein